MTFDPQFDYIHRNVEAMCTALEKEIAKAGTTQPVDLEIAIKTQSAQAALAAGRALEACGRPALLAHNRVQEAQVTTPFLRAAQLPSFTSVLIGPLQKNKINHALRVFNQFETLDSLELARAVSQRVAGEPLQVMLQVNTSREDTKSGFLPEGAVEAAAQIAQLPGLEVIGFMTIGAFVSDQRVVAKSFADLRLIRDEAVKLPELSQAVELSMGMSGDYPLAIAEGATRIRVGTAIFGSRLS